MKNVLEALKTVDKKLWFFLGGIFVVALIAVIGTKIYYNINNSSLTYSEAEIKLLNAAKSYYEDNKSLLPKENGGSVVINSSDLETNKYIKSLNKMIKTDSNCSGRVVVKNVNGEYLYTTYLNCDKYSTTELYKVVTKDFITTGKGLYNLNGEYVFRGEGINNYVKFDDKIWQIVKVDSSNNILLIYSDDHKILPKVVWDDRYNSSVESNDGINDFSVSRVKDSLNSLYKGTSILSKESKNKIIPYDLCVGIRKEDSTVNNNSAECSKKEPNMYFGLITVSDFVNASLDNNCKKPGDNSCQNYNYLKFEYPCWGANGSDFKTSKVYGYDDYMYSINASNERYLRMTIKFDSSIMVSGGKGTSKDPYIIN